MLEPYTGRKFFAQKMWVPTAAAPFLAARLKSLSEYPPCLGAGSLSMKKAIERAMEKAESPTGAATEARL
jgi:arylsulfatase